MRWAAVAEITADGGYRWSSPGPRALDRGAPGRGPPRRGDPGRARRALRGSGSHGAAHARDPRLPPSRPASDQLALRGNSTVNVAPWPSPALSALIVPP